MSLPQEYPDQEALDFALSQLETRFEWCCVTNPTIHRLLAMSRDGAFTQEQAIKFSLVALADQLEEILKLEADRASNPRTYFPE